MNGIDWNRTSSAWKQLKPLRNFNEFSPDDESVDQCFDRLSKAGFRIPHSVIEQWIYAHYYNDRTINNYGWIDYRKVSFVETTLSIFDLKQLYIIEAYRDYVEMRSKLKPFEDFVCISEDLQHWKSHCTWRIPPIVLDVKSLTDIPQHAEIHGNFQLIEGHSRLGYLLSMERAGILRPTEHRIFLLKEE